MAEKGKQKVNDCFICGKTAVTTEHHVKELDSEYTMELCPDYHKVITKYYEEAIPRLKRFLDDKK